MSRHELERAAVMGRVKNRDLKLSDAAVMLDVSYRQAKKKTVAAISQAGQRRANAWQHGSAVESSQAIGSAASGVELNPREIFGFGGGELQPDIGRVIQHEGHSLQLNPGSRHVGTSE